MFSTTIFLVFLLPLDAFLLSKISNPEAAALLFSNRANAFISPKSLREGSHAASTDGFKDQMKDVWNFPVLHV